MSSFQLNTISRQWRRYHLGDIGSLIPGNFGAPVVVVVDAGTAWANQVVANGGAQPSTQSIGAINVFWGSLTGSALGSKFYQINILAPDSLIAALTPLTVVNTGSKFWVNHGVVATDVALNGVSFSGSSGIYADTGVSGSLIQGGNQGMTHVNTDGNSNPLVGANNVNDTYSWALRWTNANGNFFYESFFPNTRINGTNADPFGFMSGNRSGSLSNTTASVYWGNNAHSIAVAASSTADTGSIGPADTVGVGACPTSTGTLTEQSTGKMSFIALHQGLSSAEVTTLFNSVKTLRNSLGGGWV